MNIGNCKEANKTIIEIPVGEKLECPTCHKDMLVEVKAGIDVRMIIGIAAAIVVLGGAGAYFTGVFGGGEKDNIDPTSTGDSVTLVDSVAQGQTTTPKTSENDIAVNLEPKEQKTTVTDGKEVTSPTPKPNTANLGWASYEGPTNGGKPDGMGGILTIKSNHSIDLKNGSVLDVAPGDKIKNTKFTNGVLRQGELERKNGERKYFNIG